MSYSERFRTKAEANEHADRIKELKEIQDGLADGGIVNPNVLSMRLARVVELLIQELQ